MGVALVSFVLLSLTLGAPVGGLPPALPVSGSLPGAMHASIGNASPVNSSSFNNTTNRLGQAITSFVEWFVRGLEIVIGIVFGALLVGGIVNYLLVGRKRGEWTPAEALAPQPPPAPPPPSAYGAPPPPSGGST